MEGGEQGEDHDHSRRAARSNLKAGLGKVKPGVAKLHWGIAAPNPGEGELLDPSLSI
jgi:hypothetical protein